MDDLESVEQSFAKLNIWQKLAVFASLAVWVAGMAVMIYWPVL